MAIWQNNMKHFKIRILIAGVVVISNSLIFAQKLKMSESLYLNHQPSDSTPIIFTDRVSSVPDVMQMDNSNEFPDNGSYYCAPVSVANYFVWLSKNGFENLVLEGKTDKEKVLNLAKLLGSKKYMSVTSAGIPPSVFLDKTIQYVKNCGYQIHSSNHWDFNHYSSNKSPTIEHIKKGLQNNGMVWLLIGKYTYYPTTQIYKALAFHYIAVIGYGTDQAKQYKSNYLIINCSSPRSGT